MSTPTSSQYTGSSMIASTTSSSMAAQIIKGIGCTNSSASFTLPDSQHPVGQRVVSWQMVRSSEPATGCHWVPVTASCSALATH